MTRRLGSSLREVRISKEDIMSLPRDSLLAWVAVCAIAGTQPVRSQVTLTVRNPIRLARTADAIAAGATDLKRLLAIDNIRRLQVRDQRAGRTC